MDNAAKKFFAILQKSGTAVTAFNPDEREAHMRRWFEEVVPPQKRQVAIDSHCFSSDFAAGYLWHVFSYEIIGCLKGSEAKLAFDGITKQGAVLLASWDDIPSCEIGDASRITSAQIDALCDVIITDLDFNWTYVKTHEPCCGPYFHEIRSK